MYLETATTEISCPPLFKSTTQQELTSAASVPALRWSLDRVKLKGNYRGNALLAAGVTHKAQNHHSHCGGNGLGQTSSAGTVGAKSQVMHCHAGVSLSCCAVPLALNYFLSLTGRETQLVPRVCRGEIANTKGTATIKSRAKEASFPMDLCLASWADWPFLFSFLTSPDRPSCFPSPRISLGTYLCVSAKQSAFQVRDPGYSTDWKSKSSGWHAVGLELGAPCMCVGPAHGPWGGEEDQLHTAAPRGTQVCSLLPSHWFLHARTPPSDPWKQMLDSICTSGGANW